MISSNTLCDNGKLSSPAVAGDDKILLEVKKNRFFTGAGVPIGHLVRNLSPLYSKNVHQQTHPLKRFEPYALLRRDICSGNKPLQANPLIL